MESTERKCISKLRRNTQETLVGKSQTLGLKISLAMFSTLAAIDLYTTLRLGELAALLETNPLFLLTKSFLVITLMNIIFFWLVVFLYKRYGSGIRFFIITWVTWINIWRFSAIGNALKTKADPPTIEAASAITNAVKQEYYIGMILAFYAPLVITIIIYLLFRIDHNVDVKIK